MHIRLMSARPPAGLLAVFVVATAAGANACNKGDPNLGPTPGSGEITGLSPLGVDQRSPLDAAPSPDGAWVAFIARDAEGGGALYQISAAGGEARLLAGGFMAPVQVAVSLDGASVFVADIGEEANEGARGAIFRVGVADGQKAEIPAASGYSARGLDVVEQDGQEVLYFSGSDPADGGPGLFRIVGGGPRETVFRGDALHDPSGIAVAASGAVYVADPAQDVVLAVKDGVAAPLVEGVALGYPAGIALSQDEKFLLVSALDRVKKSALVLRVELASGQAQRIEGGLSASSESAGLHRGKNTDRFAWADADDPASGRSGTVFLVGTKAAPLP